jgi:hypothetical protein
MQIELWQRVIIKFLAKENLGADEILAKLQARFKDKASALQTVRFWMGQVQRGCEDLRDEHRSGRSPLDYIDTQITVIHLINGT